MPAPSFVHLHVHTHYSLLDGVTRVEALVDRAKQFNMPAVAITDHGNMFGVIELYTAARRAGIKPIIGCEAYLAPGDRRQKDGTGGNKEYYHLLLLAMNREGYQNLIRLASIGYLEGFYRKPRIDKTVLRECSGGLLCTSTCLSGEIPRTLLNRDRAAAEEIAKTYLDIFGPDRFFVELQDHGLPEQRTLNPELADLANRLGVATIATNDVHYLDQQDAEAQDVLCCINTGKFLADRDRLRFDSDQFYFKSASEMATLFAEYPDAIAHTLHVAELCNLELDLSKRYAPVFKMPGDGTSPQGGPIEEDSPAGSPSRGAPRGVVTDDAAYLRELVYAGAKERYENLTPELRERIDYELDVITRKGFASYFLIVWDCVNYARRHAIPAGARGSACSSVVSYCLRISAPDPIRYGLYFERFMDPDRDEMPDIDLDICQNGRGQVLDYVREKYGHVAQIITFGTLKAKAVIKDVSRVLGLGFEEANGLTKLIPNELKMTLDKALAQEPELKKRYETDSTVRRIVDLGRRLEGVARNAGVHAAGVVIADEPLVNFLPLYKAPNHSGLLTQYDGPTVERVGLLKMDFLGLRTLSTVERARQLAERSTGRRIDLEHLDLTDPKVYELFARGDTKGIFQFESGGMREVIMRMKPNRIEDLIAANALYRPGPMEYIPEYIARKHGAAWTTPHPIMTEVLQETYGIMVYQEQVSRLVHRLGGIELKAAFRLAKAISKKKTDMIEAMRDSFLEGCVRSGVKATTAEHVFHDILKFGGYAFNKAHSTGYALVAYQTAWMKAHFPVEFMAALMTFEMGNTDKVVEYRKECQERGIRIEPPSINASEYDFVVETTAGPAEPSKVIRFGLGAVKGVGSKAVAAIVGERVRGGAFENLFDFCERVDLSAVNRTTIEALIFAGAFDTTGGMRKALAEALDRAMTAGQAAQRDRRSGQMSLFSGDSPAPTAPPPTASPSPGPAEPGLHGSSPSQPVLSTSEWTEAEMLAHEKAVLGFYITRHPLASREELLRACATATTADLARYPDGHSVIVGGMVSSLRTVAARSGRNTGKRLGIITLEDLTGRTEAVLFPDDLVTYRPLLSPDALVFIQGAVDRKREEPSLRVSRVVRAVSAVSELGTALLLNLTPDAPIQPMVRLLREHAGACRVYVNVETTDGLVAQIECHSAIRVACDSELIAGLVDLLGVNAVCVLGPAQRPIPLAQGPRPAAPPPAA